MAINAEQLNIILAARDKEFTKAMERSQRRVEMFAKQSNKNLSKTTRGFNTLNTAAKGLLPSLGVAAVVGGLARMANAVGEMARNITNLSSVAGIGIEQFQEMAFAADRVGISQEKFADILKDVNDKIGDFLSTGAGPMKDFFEQIAPQVGVTAEQFRNLNSADALQLYVSSLEKANLSQAEMTFYMEAIASDATALLPLLRGNGDEMVRLSKIAKETGQIMDESMAQTALRAQETWDRVLKTLKGKFMSFASDVLGGMDIVFGITEGGKAIKLKGEVDDALSSYLDVKRQVDDEVAKGGGGSAYLTVLQSEMQGALEELGLAQRAYAEVANELASIEAARQRLAQLSETSGSGGGGDGGGGSPPSTTKPRKSKVEDEIIFDPRDPRYDRVKVLMAQIALEAEQAGTSGTNAFSSISSGALAAVPDVEAVLGELERLDEIGSTLESSMERAFMSMLDGTATAQDAFRAMAKDIISELYRVLVVQELVGKFETGGGGILGGIFSAFSGRASGGSVHAGSPYMVGENGPEPFVPAQNGRILSTSQAKAAIGGGGGGVVINQSISVNQGGQNIPPERLFREIRVAATDAVADAMQRGGGFRGVMS